VCADNLKTVQGGCYCGALRFEATGDFAHRFKCDCSYCKTKNTVLAYLPKEAFKLIQGEGAYSVFRQEKTDFDHAFCNECGTEPFGFGLGLGNAPMVAVNLHCIDGLSVEQIPVASLSATY
jgi:hypothetical protein